MKLPSTYNASDYEPGIYKLWENSGVFVADPKSKKKHFSIDMPPPNETGTLHIGHALGLTIQDIIARHERAKGKDVLWLPGTDHAAIATNAIIEEKLRKEGTNKHEIGRDKFLEITKDFVANSRDTINSQIRAMGASVDWTRARYTLSDTLNRCVNETFTKMYNDGLIYRGHRIVNWDPKLETNVSDDEVEYREEKTKFYTFKFGPFEISTSRPETKFADKYVVMHPKDKRYTKYKEGDQFEAEWINGKVKATVIKDEAIDPEFGTGVMTITPWHSVVDFEIAERHGLDKVQVIDLHGKLLPIAEEFEGLSIEEARPKIVDKLDIKGLLINVQDNYIHNVALNSRGKGVIEPQIRLQWFVDVNKPVVMWKGSQLSLKSVLQDVVRSGDTEIIPSRYDKVYFSWIDNLRDWCISRQIWWGHQIPVWYKKGSDEKEETYVGVLPPKDAQNWTQDPDTLDTWFSSALWTWSTLIDPELAKNFELSIEDLLKFSPDFNAYHPTNVLDTGWDIIFFWVSRMILATTYMTGQVPFKQVYLHGLVLTAEGSKMSKSNPESIVDPMEVIPEYGSDSLRLALIQGMSAGNNQKMVKSKVITNRNFCNKLWNVARYIEGIIADLDEPESPEPETIADHWILRQLIFTKDQINSDLDHYYFSDAYNKLFHFLRDDLADWYVEASKVNPNKQLLKYLIKNVLIISHPMAPYVTEAIWQNMEEKGSLLAAQKYARIINHDEKAATKFEQLKIVISEARQIRHALGERQVAMNYKKDSLIDKNRTLISKLAGISRITETDKPSGLKLTGTHLHIWLDVDKAKAKDYLAKLSEKDSQIKAHIKRLESRLGNKSYISNAPEDVVEETKRQLVEYLQQETKVVDEITLFKSI